MCVLWVIYWRQVIGSNNGLMKSRKKSLHELLLTKITVTLLCPSGTICSLVLGECPERPRKLTFALAVCWTILPCRYYVITHTPQNSDYISNTNDVNQVCVNIRTFQWRHISFVVSQIICSALMVLCDENPSVSWANAWTILGMGSANERRRYIVMSSLNGWAQNHEVWFLKRLSVPCLTNIHA